MTEPTDATLTEHLALLAERLSAGAHVLDLGCSSGRRVVHLADRFTIAGIDISFEQVHRARQLLPHARIVQADMTRLEFTPTGWAPPTYFSGYDVETNHALLQAAGFEIVTGREARRWETIDDQTGSVRLFWVITQRSGQSRESSARSL